MGTLSLQAETFPKALALTLTALALACGGSPATLDTTPSDDLTQSKTSWFLVEPDTRRCPAPACGGVWLEAVNLDVPAVYASALDYRRAGLDDASLELARETPLPELLVRGRVGTKDGRGNVPFFVSEVLRGLPGMRPAEWTFFQVEPSGRTCVTAPCLELDVTLLNRRKTSAASALVVDRALAPLADASFALDRTLAHRGVVAARLVSSGRETIVDASQVYVRLPVDLAPCREAPETRCSPGEEAVYERDANLCLNQTGCAVPPSTLCPADAAPTCLSGYASMGWRTATTACLEWRCDPGFVVGE